MMAALVKLMDVQSLKFPIKDFKSKDPTLFYNFYAAYFTAYGMKPIMHARSAGV